MVDCIQARCGKQKGLRTNQAAPCNSGVLIPQATHIGTLRNHSRRYTRIHHHEQKMVAVLEAKPNQNYGESYSKSRSWGGYYCHRLKLLEGKIMLIITLGRCKELMSKEGFELFKAHQLEIDSLDITTLNDDEEFALSRIEQLQYEVKKKSIEE